MLVPPWCPHSITVNIPDKQTNPPPALQESRLGAHSSSGHPLPIQLLADNQRSSGGCPRALDPCTYLESGGGSWLPASDPHCSGLCSHLRSEPVDEESSLSASFLHSFCVFPFLCNPDFHVKNNSFKKCYFQFIV